MITSYDEICLLRLAAQRLAGAFAPTVTDAVRWMTAMQGQDLRGAMTSVALRTEGATAADVQAAFGAGTIVRSWPMRGTLHVVAADDLDWMLRLTGDRVIGATAGRRRTLGLDDPALATARLVAEECLRGGNRMTREELFARWQDAGLATDGQRGIHYIFHLAHARVLCYGPFEGTKQQLVLSDEWVPRPRVLDREEALGEWALRFFRSHGPATVEDFARWTKLPLKECRRGIAAAESQLQRCEFDGVVRWLDPRTPDLLATVRSRAEGMFLLPGFDEFILGYADRTVMIPAVYANAVVPGNNGMFQHTVVSRGQVIGTWKRAPRGRIPPVVATPFDPSGTFDAAIQAEITRLAAVLPL